MVEFRQPSVQLGVKIFPALWFLIAQVVEYVRKSKSILTKFGLCINPYWSCNALGIEREHLETSQSNLQRGTILEFFLIMTVGLIMLGRPRIFVMPIGMMQYRASRTARKIVS